MVPCWLIFAGSWVTNSKMDQIHTKNWAWSAKSNRSTGKADADAELAFAIRVSKVHWNGYSGRRDEESIIPVTTLRKLRQAQDLELSQSLKSEKFKTSNRFHPEDLPKKKTRFPTSSNLPPSTCVYQPSTWKIPEFSPCFINGSLGAPAGSTNWILSSGRVANSIWPEMNPISTRPVRKEIVCVTCKWGRTFH